MSPQYPVPTVFELSHQDSPVLGELQNDRSYFNLVPQKVPEDWTCEMTPGADCLQLFSGNACFSMFTSHGDDGRVAAMVVLSEADGGLKLLGKARLKSGLEEEWFERLINLQFAEWGLNQAQAEVNMITSGDLESAMEEA